MRRVHLVGSLPAANAEEALAMVQEHVGDRLCPWVSDGETGDRKNWVQRLVNKIGASPDLELVREGGWSDYQDTPAFRVGRGRHLRTVELDYVEAFASSREAFLRAKNWLPEGTRFMVGVPGVLDLSMVIFGLDAKHGLRHTGPFRDATVREMLVISDRARAEVVFQLELPIEVGMVYRPPRRAARPISLGIAADVATAARRGPIAPGYGIHLCNGDMNNKAVVKPDDLSPLTELANALVRAWPKDRHLEFVHLPFARGDEPPPSDPGFYDPLRQLRIPRETRLAAGFVHEANTFEEALAIRAAIEGRAGRQVDVAAACGLGRRTKDQAVANLDLSRRLASAE